MIEEIKLIRKLGDGASAQVFEAIDLQSEKRYAVKVFSTEKGECNAEYEQEAYIHRKLSHKYIIGYKSS